MRRTLRVIIGAIVITLAFTAAPAFAGSPHFVKTSLSATVSEDGATLFVSGKEAGLGDEDTVDIQVSATAECVNGGGKHPKATNKMSVSDVHEVPVQNGKANFSFELTADFQPSCSPPMTVRWSNVVVTDLTNGISESIRIR